MLEKLTLGLVLDSGFGEILTTCSKLDVCPPFRLLSEVKSVLIAPPPSHSS